MYRKFVLLLLVGLGMTNSFAEVIDVASWPIKEFWSRNPVAQREDRLVTFRQVKESWVIDQSADLYSDKNDAEQILICQSCGDGEIIVMAGTVKNNSCTRGVLTLEDEKRSRSGYNVCQSALYSCPTNVAQAIIGWQMALTGTRMCTPKLDIQKTREILVNLKISEWLVEVKNIDHINQQQLEFGDIDSSLSATKFINKYKENDPANLLAKTEQKRLDFLRQEETIARNALQRATEANEFQLKQAEKERQRVAEKIEIDRIENAKRLKLTQEFRKNIQLGSDTFCGPVIAIRGPMIQIAVNVQLPGFAPEPWLKIDQIFPATVASCQNANGHLSPIWLR